MEIYRISQKLEMSQKPLTPGERALVLLTTQEMEHPPQLARLENIIRHIPSAQGARGCAGGGPPRLFERDSDYTAAYQGRDPHCFWIFADIGPADIV